MSGQATCPDAVFLQAMRDRYAREMQRNAREMAHPVDTVGVLSDMIMDNDPTPSQVTNDTLWAAIEMQAKKCANVQVGCTALLLKARLCVLQQLCMLACKQENGFYCGNWVAKSRPDCASRIQEAESWVVSIAQKTFKGKNLDAKSCRKFSVQQVADFVEKQVAASTLS